MTANKKVASVASGGALLRTVRLRPSYATYGT